MLIQTDKSELGDKKLGNKDEILAREKEKNKALLASRKVKDQAVLEDREAAKGQVLHTGDFIRLLQKICPGLIVEPGGYPNAVALRRWVNGEKKYVTGFELGYIPEYSSIIPDENGLPFKEVRGWRNVLVSLTKQGLINMEALKREFGRTQNNVHGKFIDSQLQGR